MFAAIKKSSLDELLNKMAPGIVAPTDAKTDEEYVAALKPQWKSTLTEAEIQAIRGRARVRQFKTIFQTLSIVIPRGSNYLDFGAAGGELSQAIGKYFKLITHATDVPSWHNQHRPDGIDTRYYKYQTLKDGKIPFNKKFKLITCLMVLHHIKDWQASLRDIIAHLDWDGILVIREHDANSREVVDMCHVEHLIHSCVFENQTVQQFKHDYYGAYQSIPDWRDQIIKLDPRLQCVWGDTPTGPTRYSFTAFKFSALSRSAK